LFEKAGILPAFLFSADNLQIPSWRGQSPKSSPTGSAEIASLPLAARNLGRAQRTMTGLAVISAYFDLHLPGQAGYLEPQPSR
jgi:hypothetical protein